jgi:hypothetical protein
MGYLIKAEEGGNRLRKSGQGGEKKNKAGVDENRSTVMYLYKKSGLFYPDHDSFIIAVSPGLPSGADGFSPRKDRLCATCSNCSGELSRPF